METERQDGFAQIHGSPGTRVRFAGLARLFWPFVAGIAMAGYLARCAIPLPEMPPATAAYALVVLAGFTWWLHGRAIRRFGNFLKGAQGEERVARELALLPAAFEVFHGLSNPSGGGDFDHVVVGPGGIAVVETKNWSGPVTYTDGRLLAQGRLPTRSPEAQVRREAAQLRRRLERAGGDPGEVLPVICLAGNTFEAEALGTDELTVCNSRSLCAVLIRALGGDSSGAADAQASVREILRQQAQEPA